MPDTPSKLFGEIVASSFALLVILNKLNILISILNEKFTLKVF
jgi:hypothetical protein